MNRISIRPLSVALSLVLAASSAIAEEPLDLADVMRRARASSWEVQAAAARIEAREADHAQARAQRWPRLTVEEVFTRTSSPADAFGLTLMQERFSFADFVAGDPNDPATVQDAMTRFELQVPLWTGGEIAARIGQARAAAEAASFSGERSADESAAAAGRAWLAVAEAREGVLLLERALATVEAHVRFARAHVEAGTLVASELLRAEVERARIADQLVEARGFADVAAAELVFRLGGDEGVRNAVLTPVPLPIDLASERDALIAAVASRADLEAARRGHQALALGEQVARAARHPRVGLMVRHELHDRDLFGASGDSTTVAVFARLELFDAGRSRSAIASARAENAAMAAEISRAESGARLEAEGAWIRATSARDRQLTAAQALEAAREAERIVEVRYGQGVVRTLDLLDASTARREAEARELAARAAAWRATLELALAAGRPPESMLTSFPSSTTIPGVSR